MTTLYLARHGETEENAAGILQGHLPGRLTATGLRQAQELAGALPPVRFDALLSSDLARALATAAVLSRRTGLPVVPCPLLRERDWGCLTGRPVEEARRYDAFPPDVETVQAMFARAERFVGLVRTHYGGGTVLAVGHGLFCRCIQAALRGYAIRDTPRWNNAELRCLHVGDAALRSGNTAESGATAD